MNNMLLETREEIIKRFAYQAYCIRKRCGLEGDEKLDYFDGIKMYEDYCSLHTGLDRWKE